ncbi:hypothetical protein AB1Y20_017874 [Prymnesium parvum]|uniref:Bifunctional lysine-specific demethylase and histidyl-hydroxylase n=1 Tax=Prymnesium parvum TaxID=97485 RepID=A0AB34JQJ0_PRYPA
MVKGSSVDGWASDCRLTAAQRAQRASRYDTTAYDFVGAASAYLGAPLLAQIHLLPPPPAAATPPPLLRALVQARAVPAPPRAARDAARKRARRSVTWEALLSLYRRFIEEVIMREWRVDLLYQAVPVLRVVLPGSVAPCKPHCDADYFHDANEVNYWLPLTPVWGSNSLWAESSPGAADFAPFELCPGELMRFYGNRCHHFTLPNETGASRVSIDFRVLPLHLHVPPAEREAHAAALMQTPHLLDAGGYYAVARAARAPQAALAHAPPRVALVLHVRGGEGARLVGVCVRLAAASRGRTPPAGCASPPCALEGWGDGGAGTTGGGDACAVLTRRCAECADVCKSCSSTEHYVDRCPLSTRRSRCSAAACNARAAACRSPDREKELVDVA